MRWALTLCFLVSVAGCAMSHEVDPLADPADPDDGDSRPYYGALPPSVEPSLPDADGDTISDFDEGRAENRDTDADGLPDFLDTDSDGDGTPDYVEAGDDDLLTPPFDSDGDRVPEYLQP